jgi:outer membrane protein TolC
MVQNQQTAKILDENLKVNDEAAGKAYKKTLDKEKLNVHDLFTLAVKYSEKMAIAKEDIIQSREKTRQAWGAVLPQLSFRANLNLPATASTGGLFTQGFRFYARQNILTGLNEFSGIRAAPLQEKYSALQLKSQEALLYDQIAQIFFEYLLLEDSLDTQNILLESSTDLKNELEKRFYLGKARRSEILNVEAVIAKTQAQIVNTRVLLSEAQKKIAELTGLERNFIPENPENENNFNLENYTENFLEQPVNMEKRPDLMSLKTAWELAKITSISLLGGHLPTIYLEGQYRIPDSAAATSGSTTDYYAGIVAQFPLFSGGIVHSQYLVAKSQERQAELRYRELLRNAREELNFYVHSWQSGEKQFSMLKTAKEKANSAYNTTLADYRVGQATNLEVLSALNNQASAKEEFEKTRLNQKLLIIHIKILAGELP